jgi:hypothetical protein
MQQKMIDFAVDALRGCHHSREERETLREQLQNPSPKFLEYVRGTIRDVSNMQKFECVCCNLDGATEKVLNKLLLEAI